ncbi:hypothetical protein ACK8HX_02110 [Oryzobacter sp. R7]|uniref:hypothetical protein n=1 Tax=Oryzobacter faecalis TaxID=3388656 RepID=UPI00398CFCE8
MRALRQHLTTVLELAGVAFLVTFAGLVWWPAAVGVAGVACIVLAWALERRPAAPSEAGGDVA